MSKYGLNGFDGHGEPALAIGSVAGVRWWNCDGHTLTGVHGAWSLGENAAHCRRRDVPSDAHIVPDEDCACGFWAYWTTEATGNPHGFRLPVLGVIEGYGRTLIGEKGFRCAKARIVALHIPDAGIDPKWLTDPDVPPSIRARGDGAIATYRALCGKRPSPSITSGDLIARQVQLEAQLEEAYGVPVYYTPGLMLANHPPTPDYLPPSARPVAFNGAPRLTVAERLALMDAKRDQWTSAE